MLYINYVLCWRYIVHVLSILYWHVFCFPKKTCFIYIKNTSLIQKHSSITLTWDCLCGKGMPFWRIKGVPFMRCISTHKWIWSRLCGRRVMRRHSAVNGGEFYAVCNKAAKLRGFWVSEVTRIKKVFWARVLRDYGQGEGQFNWEIS